MAYDYPQPNQRELADIQSMQGMSVLHPECSGESSNQRGKAEVRVIR